MKWLIQSVWNCIPLTVPLANLILSEASQIPENPTEGGKLWLQGTYTNICKEGRLLHSHFICSRHKATNKYMEVILCELGYISISWNFLDAHYSSYEVFNCQACSDYSVKIEWRRMQILKPDFTCDVNSIAWLNFINKVIVSEQCHRMRRLPSWHIFRRLLQFYLAKIEHTEV